MDDYQHSWVCRWPLRISSQNNYFVISDFSKSYTEKYVFQNGMKVYYRRLHSLYSSRYFRRNLILPFWRNVSHDSPPMMRAILCILPDFIATLRPLTGPNKPLPQCFPAPPPPTQPRLIQRYFSCVLKNVLVKVFCNKYPKSFTIHHTVCNVISHMFTNLD